MKYARLKPGLIALAMVASLSARADDAWLKNTAALKSEASASGDDVMTATGAALSTEHATASQTTSKPGLMARIGQGRLASAGCPHCDSDDIRKWARLAANPGIVARPAIRPSIR